MFVITIIRHNIIIILPVCAILKVTRQYILGHWQGKSMLEVCKTFFTDKIAVPELLLEPADHPSSLWPACHLQCTSQTQSVMECLGILQDFASTQQPGSLLVMSDCAKYPCKVATDWSQCLLPLHWIVCISTHWHHLFLRFCNTRYKWTSED